MRQKKTIGGRITKAVLIICVLTMLIAAFFSTIARVRLQSLLSETGTAIGTAASEKSADALLEQSMSSSRDFIVARAEMLDMRLKSILNYLTVLQFYATSLYESPGNFPPGTVPRFDAVPEGAFAVYYVQNPAVPLAPEIEDEINMLSGLWPIVNAVMGLDDWLLGMYFVTESGPTVFFDDRAGESRAFAEHEAWFRERPWYLNAVKREKAVITDTYEDAAEGELFITFSIPVYKQSGELAGVMAADMSMVRLADAIEEMTAGGVDFRMLLGHDRIIAAPNLRRFNLTDGLPHWFDVILANENGAVTQSVPNWLGPDFLEVDLSFIWEQLSLTDWKLVGMSLIDNVVAPAEEMRAGIDALAYQAVEDAQSTAAVTSLATLAALAGTLIFGLYYSKKTSKRISSPIASLTADAVKIGQGELDYVLEIKTDDEIEILAGTINKMVDDIKRFTGEKERIGAELNVAAQIQASMLPRISTAFPNRPEFDIYAAMIPAKEIGGDFYDFFLIDDYKLAMVIADVSGKGISAALFMAIVKTLIKNSAQSGKAANEVFEIVNNALCENNEAQMFVTAFMGIWDMKTGVFTYVNAGHNPPLLKRAGGAFEWLNTAKPGFVLAGMEGIAYRQNEITLRSGDTIFMYTDGVTEATNPQNELFSNSRLLKTVNRHKPINLNEFITHIKNETDKFVNGAEQIDDITMLIMQVSDGAQ